MKKMYLDPQVQVCRLPAAGIATVSAPDTDWPEGWGGNDDADPSTNQ